MPLVSVIIPAYGHADYILQTLDSVFSQTFVDYETIVVNDGSPDNTPEVLANLIEMGVIRYFEQQNQGVAAARNFGISQAKGEFIALIDDDDLWPPDKLEWQLSELRARDAIAVGGSVAFIGSECETNYVSCENGSIELNLERFFGGNPFISPGQVMFRRSVFEQGIRFDPSIWGVDDLDFWIGLTIKGRFFRCDQLSLYYRIHNTNASHNRLKMLTNSQKVLKKRFAMLESPQLERCVAKGYRWLFEYLGRELIWEARVSLLSKRPRVLYGIYLFWVLFKVFAYSFRDAPDTFAAIKSELKAAFVNDVWQALKRRMVMH